MPFTQPPASSPTGDIAASTPILDPPVSSVFPSPTTSTDVLPVPGSELATMTPSDSLSLRYSEVRQVLLDVSSSELLDDPTSAQYMTMEWLVKEDEAQVPPTEPFVLIQRFIIALFYFAFRGSAWWKDYGFLSGTNICEWNDNGYGGCFCSNNNSNAVKMLSLCKFRTGSFLKLFHIH
jgi:hypothetical protein